MSNVIDDLMHRAYKDMDPTTGMFPEAWCCTKCGKRLNADGNHPAELYAGTFTGLCYPCTSGGPFVLKVFTYDGARMVSYPPHCPSWRRDRETYYGYADCTECYGMGTTGMNPSHNWSRTYKRCTACSERFYATQRPCWDRGERAMKAAQADYETQLLAHAFELLGVKVPKRLSQKRRGEAIASQLKTEFDVALAAQLLARYDALRDRIDARYADRFATRPPTPEDQ